MYKINTDLNNNNNPSSQSAFFNQNLDYHFLKNQFNQCLKKTMITIGQHSTFVLTLDGNVYGCGQNHYGQLGLGDTNDRFALEKLPLESVVKVIAGIFHTFFQLKDDSILCCGMNTYGQLGLGKEDKILTPTNLSFPSDMNIKNIQITVGGGLCSFILDENGKIWGTGTNIWGQLGFEDKGNYLTFSTLPIDGVKQVISNGVHTFFLKDKEVWGCGSNRNQMELEDPLEHGILNIQKISSKPIKKIISGTLHTIIQKKDGIWGCGSNEAGQLGLGENIKHSNLVKLPIDSVKEFFVGPKNTFFLLKNGEIWACGDNYSGQLGLGNSHNKEYQPKQLPIAVHQVIDIIAGPDHTLFLLKDGRVLGCGSNEYGQLGLGPDIKAVLTPQELPLFTECLGLHARYKEIEALNPANNVNKNSNQKSEKSNAESNSSEFQNNNNNYKP